MLLDQFSPCLAIQKALNPTPNTGNKQKDRNQNNNNNNLVQVWWYKISATQEDEPEGSQIHALHGQLRSYSKRKEGRE
jgi:hypothetical protein